MHARVVKAELEAAAVLCCRCRHAKSSKELLPRLLLLLLAVVLQLLADACQLEAQQPLHLRSCYYPLHRIVRGQTPARAAVQMSGTLVYIYDLLALILLAGDITDCL
jgi:hypothetical protein